MERHLPPVKRLAPWFIAGPLKQVVVEFWRETAGWAPELDLRVHETHPLLGGERMLYQDMVFHIPDRLEEDELGRWRQTIWSAVGSACWDISIREIEVDKKRRTVNIRTVWHGEHAEQFLTDALQAAQARCNEDGVIYDDE